MDRPDPAEYQPQLRLWSHLWRLGFMLLISAAVWGTAVRGENELIAWWWALDLVLGAAAYVLVFYRRRRPVLIPVVVCLLGTVSGLAAGPAVLATVSVATRRRWREIALVGCLGYAASQFYSTVTDTQNPVWAQLILNAISASLMIAWGMYIGSRRELVWTLRHRAERAEAEQELRVGQARGQERERIAREMHDVLAHRISQIAMYAGALEYRDDLSPEEMRASAEVIRDRAHLALTDLRDVLGVLRDDQPAAGRPQPTYADLGALVAEAEASGLRIEFEDLAAHGVPDATGRTVYRIVQEGMTNARKHAPGALLTVRITGSADDGIEVLLRNPVGFGPTRTPGAGLGLVGLTERAELRGGWLQSGPDGPTFVLRSWIPWGA